MGNLKQLPFGFRFLPTDLELIKEFLMKKLRNQQFSCNVVVELDVYSTEPWNLKGSNDHIIGGAIDKDYYFVHREKKSAAGNGVRPNRVVNPSPTHGSSRGGFWKATSGDVEILDNRNNLVGVKKSLKFFQFTTDRKTTKNSVKTGWIMHEYTLPPRKNEFQPWVLCSIRFIGDDVEYHHQKHASVVADQKMDEKIQQEAPDHHHHHHHLHNNVEPAGIILQQEHQQQLQQEPLIPMLWQTPENIIFKNQDFGFGENDMMMMQQDYAGGGLLTSTLLADVKYDEKVDYLKYDLLNTSSSSMKDASAMYPGACSTNHHQVVQCDAKRPRLIRDNNNAHDDQQWPDEEIENLPTLMLLDVDYKYQNSYYISSSSR